MRKRTTSVLAVLATTALIALVGSNVASAAHGRCPHMFGSPQQLVDGAVVQQWTVTDLRRSADPAPGYPLAGRLWEATATVEAISGSVTPIIPNFYAWAPGGAVYPVLWQLATPQGIPAVSIAPGQKSTGTLYFDVTGSDPVLVAYATGGATRMIWHGMPMPMGMPMIMPMDMPMGDCAAGT